MMDGGESGKPLPKQDGTAWQSNKEYCHLCGRETGMNGTHYLFACHKAACPSPQKLDTPPELNQFPSHHSEVKEVREEIFVLEYEKMEERRGSLPNGSLRVFVERRKFAPDNTTNCRRRKGNNEPAVDGVYWELWLSAYDGGRGRYILSARTRELAETYAQMVFDGKIEKEKPETQHLACGLIISPSKCRRVSEVKERRKLPMKRGA